MPGHITGHITGHGTGHGDVMAGAASPPAI